MAQPAKTPSTASNVSAGPQWADLSAAQQASLAPLAGSWSSIGTPQKQKWIEASKRFASLPPAEQARLRSRMTEWAGMSTAQRNQARLNFAETKQLTPEQKKSQWEAYQALTPLEKQRLASGAPAKPAGAALAVTPAPKQLATVPPSRSELKGPSLLKKRKLPAAAESGAAPTAPSTGIQ